jgi:large repetitive protein
MSAGLFGEMPMQGARTVVLLSLLLAGVVGAGLWFGLRDPETTGRSGSSTGVAGPAAEDLPPPLPDRPAPKAAHGQGQISGRVLLFKTGAPVKDVVVRLSGGPAGGGGREELTDAEGNVSFRDLPAGSGYEVLIAHGEFAPVERPGIDVVNGEISDLGILFLERAVAFTVRVEDGATDPVAAATVRIFAATHQTRAYGYNPGSWMDGVLAATRIPTAIKSGETDASGEVEIEGLPAGYYSVAASADGYARAGVERLLTPDNAGEPVVLRIGKGFTLVGSVTSDEGEIVEGAVLASPVGIQGGVGKDYLRGLAAIDEGGAYELTGLPPGMLALTVLTAAGVPVPAGNVKVPELDRFDILLGGGGAIEGTVTDPEGEPVAGAEVRGLVRPPRGVSQFAAQGVTDEEGNFRMEGLPSGSLTLFEVLAEGFARYPPPGQMREQKYISDESVLRIDARLTRGVALIGTVSVKDGNEPVPGAKLLLIPRSAWSWATESATTGPDGTFRVESLAPGEYAIQVTAEGYFQADFPGNQWQVRQPQNPLDEKWKVRIEPGVPETKKDFEVSSGAVVRGTVEDERGQPVGRASLNISGQRRAVPVLSSEDGTFEFTGVRESERATITASLPGRYARSNSFAVMAGAEVEGIRLTMKASCRVTGRVELQDGGSPLGATVRAVPGDVLKQPWALRQGGAGVPVAPDGSFIIDDAPPGAVTLVAQVPEHPTGLSEVLQLSGGTEMAGVVIRIERGHVLTGEVVLAGGGGVAGAAIRVYGRGTPGSLPGRGLPWGGGQATVAQTDSSGEFTLSGLAPGSYTVTADKDGLIPASQRNVDPASGTPIQLEMTAGETISGTVEDDGGQPVSGMSVTLQKQEGRGGQLSQATSGPDGAFTLKGVPEGVYKVTASSGWGGTVNYTSAVKEGVHSGETGVRLTVSPGLTISGRVTDPDGKPASGFVVRVYMTDRAIQGSSVSKYAQSQFDGTFEANGLSAGNYSISIEARGGEMASTVIPNVAAGTLGLEVQIGRAMDIEGVVVAPDGSAASGVRVSAEPMPGSPGTRGSGRTGADGTYRVQRLSPGTYKLTFTASGKYVTGVLTDVPAGAAGVNFRMEEGLIIAGKAVNPDGAPAGGVSLSATTVAGGRAAAGVTKPDGTFRLGGLAEGKYLLTVSRSRDGYVLEKPLEVESGKEDVKLELTYGLSIAGTVVDAQGKAVSAAWISVRSARGISARTDANGLFELKGLSPGTFKLYVYGNGVQAQVDAVAGSRSLQIRLE